VAPRLRNVRRAPRATVARRAEVARRPIDAQRGALSTRPLSRWSKLALALLTDTPTPARDVRRQLGCTHNQLTPALYSLQQHGLAERRPAGWVAIGEQT